MKNETAVVWGLRLGWAGLWPMNLAGVASTKIPNPTP